MESIQTIAASVGAPQTVIARPAPAPVVQAVPTELSPAQSVTASNTAEPTNNNTQSNPNDYQNTTLIDPATREVVSRIVDARSGQIIEQLPPEATLRMQAYEQALANGKTVTQALALMDLEA